MNPVGSRDHLQRARVLYDARRYDLAVTSSLDAIAEDPNDAAAHVILSLSYDRVGRLREAEAAAQRAIALDPERSQAYVAIGIVRLSQRRYPEALLAFREAARLDAFNDDAYRLAAIAQMNQNHYPDALTMIARAMEIDPDVISTREVHAMILRMLGRQVEAETETANVLRMHPESVLGLSQEGFLRLQRGDPARARAAFREALRLDPNSESVRAGYERVVVKSTAYADWCGPQLFFVGLFFFFTSVTAGHISADLGAASMFTAFVIWIVNRPIAVEALRDDEIGRTFLEPAVIARNHIVLLYAALAEVSLFVEVPLARDVVFAATLGFITAAIATERSMRRSIRSGVRTVYARLAHILAALGVTIAVVSLSRFALDPQLRAGGFEFATSAALGSGFVAVIALFVLDLVFVAPGLARALVARYRRR